ncbi:MAG TPA: amidohydrolase family protein, partial [Candidatus Agrococcus pullicola]|nr:amidohydrolase family protein [Candidatus Agrococcus pullicola]
VDLQGSVVTAGFWNSHIHLTEDVWRYSGPVDGEQLQREIDDMLLSRGFVGAVDLGSNIFSTRAVRRRIESGELRGPAILTAGAGIRPWRGVQFYIKDELPWLLRTLLPTPLSAAGARRTVLRQAGRGADVIKLFTGSYVAPDSVKVMSPTVAKAATQEAHRKGIRVLAHASNREGTEVAIQAGVDALAHVPDQTAGTEALLAEAARRGVRVIPTFHMFASTVRSDEDYLGPIRDSFAGFLRLGGRALFGTDVGYMRDRRTEPEFEAMAASGMSSADILRSLTVEPVEFFAVAGDGTVREGAPADLTVLATNVEPKATDFANIRAVIRNGRMMYRTTTHS